MIDAFKAIAPVALWMFGVWLAIVGLVVLSWGWPMDNAIGPAIALVAVGVIFTFLLGLKYAAEG